MAPAGWPSWFFSVTAFLEDNAVFAAFVLIKINRTAHCSVFSSFALTGFSLHKETYPVWTRTAALCPPQAAL